MKTKRLTASYAKRRDSVQHSGINISLSEVKGTGEIYVLFGGVCFVVVMTGGQGKALELMGFVDEKTVRAKKRGKISYHRH